MTRAALPSSNTFQNGDTMPEITNDLIIEPGYLGWGNIRTGLEFYVADRGNARWEPREGRWGTDQSIGVLLQDRLEAEGANEGCSVVTIAIPGRGDKERAAKVLTAVREALADA